MFVEYVPLPCRLLPPRTKFCAPSQRLPQVRPDQPAIDAMTDLRRVAVVTIGASDTVHDAQLKMMERNVHSLFVMDDEENISGFITSTDIHGEKPMKVIAHRGCGFRDILVGDIMTAHDRLEALDMADVSIATVGHIIATLKAAGRQHAMVVEHDADGTTRIRGLFSARQLERQVGSAIQTTEIAHTFSEIVSLLV